MSRIYAQHPVSGEDVLIEIKCDWCSATIKPGPHVVDSGWRRGGYVRDSRTNAGATEWQACPEHVHHIDEMVGHE